MKQIICCFAQIGCIKVLSPVLYWYFKFWKKTPTCLYSPQHCDNGTATNRFNYLQPELSENLVTKPLERLLDFTLHFLSFYLRLANVKIRCYVSLLLLHTCLFWSLQGLFWNCAGQFRIQNMDYLQMGLAQSICVHMKIWLRAWSFGTEY